MGLYRRPGSPFWWMNVTRPNKPPLRRSTKVRVQGGTKFQTKQNRELAQAILSIEEAKYASVAFGLPVPERSRAKVPTLEQFHEQQYVPWLMSDRPDRWTQPARRLRALFYPLFKDTPLDEIRPAAIDVWRRARLATRVQPQSVNRELSYLLSLMAKAVELDRVPVSPLEKLSVEWAPSPEIIRYLSEDEDARLMRALAVRDVAWQAARVRLNAHRVARRRLPLPSPGPFKDWLTPAVALSLHCGFRRGELFTLRWADVDWVTGYITITATAAKNKRFLRRVPMNSIARTVLEGWLDYARPTDARGHVFISRQGTKLTYVQSSWDKVLISAGITTFRWHDLRHTFASWLVQRGERLEVVKELCGHRSLKTTQRYAHLAPSQLVTAVNRLAG